MEKIIIFGGTGFIGMSLANHLVKKNITPILIARNIPENTSKHKIVQWNVTKIDSWIHELEGAKAIVNLAGKSVDCLKTPDNCDTILRSRVDATKTIGKALKLVKDPPKIWVQMSTAHIYGDSLTQYCTEKSVEGYGFAPYVGKIWEKTFFDALPNTTRGIVLRTSFVIGKDGGALKSLKKIVKLGLGGKVGSGKQGISWLHEYDMNELIYQAIQKDSYVGTYIASAPNPVSNAVFMKTLRKTMHYPIGIPLPNILTKIGAKYIFKTDIELALYGRYVLSDRLKSVNFNFKYPTLDSALTNLLG